MVYFLIMGAFISMSLLYFFASIAVIRKDFVTGKVRVFALCLLLALCFVSAYNAVTLRLTVPVLLQAGQGTWEAMVAAYPEQPWDTDPDFTTYGNPRVTYAWAHMRFPRGFVWLNVLYAYYAAVVLTLTFFGLRKRKTIKTAEGVV